MGERHEASQPQESLWERTLRKIRELWPLGDPLELKDLVGRDLTAADVVRVQTKIDACLAGEGGAVSARSRAAELGEMYAVLNKTGRRRFLELLAGNYDVDNEQLEAAISARRQADDALQRQEADARLQDVLEPPRIRLLRQFNGLRGGVKFLVDLRGELLVWMGQNAELRALDRDLHRLFSSWFDIGFLELQQISWDSSAALLEKFIRYEAVHEITSWDDLKSRLELDRCCYAFFHPHMPQEPLIFVEVALTGGIPVSIHDLITERQSTTDPEKADTAVFYSISNCQSGLAGVSFGNFLIKRVVADLKSRLPNLKTFTTLSPIPGFMKWLHQQEEIRELAELDESLAGLICRDPLDVEGLKAILLDEDDETARQARDRIRQPLLGLCARYLLNAKKGRQALDRVAHFHLTNGAQILQINWIANCSAKGIVESAGMMVNYLYDLTAIEKHHERYSSEGHVAAFSAVRKLVR